MFQNLSCSLKVNGADRRNVTVIRKKGSVWACLSSYKVTLLKSTTSILFFVLPSHNSPWSPLSLAPLNRIRNSPTVQSDMNLFNFFLLQMQLRFSTKPWESVSLCIIGHEFTSKAQKTFERLSFRKASSGVYHTMVFAAERTTLTDVHRFCQDECTRNTCCDGFILNQNVLNGGKRL